MERWRDATADHRWETAVMTLDEITALEYEWLKKMPDHGLMEERHALFEKIGVYEAWRRIFREYVMLAKTGDKEALRRSLFLYWYSFAEPHELSGIPQLDAGLAQEVLGTIDDMLQKGGCDVELRWMLPFYYSIADYYIDYSWPDQFEHVRRASKENKELWRTLCLESTFENRGRLGRYWESIQKNVAKLGPEGTPPPPPGWRAPDEGKPLEERVLRLLRELGYLRSD
jgi:hypothetical protein